MFTDDSSLSRRLTNRPADNTENNFSPHPPEFSGVHTTTEIIIIIIVVIIIMIIIN